MRMCIFAKIRIRIIVVVKRADDRRMYELRVEVGVKERFMKKLVRIMMKWADHVKRMGNEILADVQKVDGKKEGQQEESNIRNTIFAVYFRRALRSE